MNTATVAKAGKRQRAKRDTAPDALLRYLLKHSVYELAIVFARGQYVLYQRDGKRLRRKGISPETLYAAFAAELGDSGWLNTDIMRCGVGAAGSFAVKFVPAHTRRFLIDAGRGAPALAITTPLPPLVFAGVSVRDGVNPATYYVWAMRDEVFSPTAQLFHAPFTNVYDEGRICWGENRPPQSAAKETIDQAWDLFITSLFTGEMGGKRSVAHPGDIRGLYQSLEGTQHYPLDDLCPLLAQQRSYYVSPTHPVTVQEVVAKYLLLEEQ